MTWARSISIASLCVVLLCDAVGVSRAAKRDKDKDGYASASHGGRDCVDQYSSVFIEGTLDCEPSNPPVFLDGSFQIADHAWVQDASGVYHLFHHAGGTSQHVFHLTTTDMQSLTLASSGAVLSPTAGAWDSHGIWAPSVVEANGVYFMFYSGTTGPGQDPDAVQRIGVATSTDLVQWVKYPMSDCPGAPGDGCVYDCDETWTTWGSGGDYDAQCRDPFVLWNDDSGHWVMFVTVRLDVPGSWSEGISVATSTDLVHWTGAGYIEATKRLSAAEGGILGQRWGGAAENAFVTKYDQLYYLTFTDWHDEEPANPDCVDSSCSMVQYVTSRSLEATPDGSPHWEYRGYTPDAGVNAVEIVIREGDTWLQTQSVANPNSGDWSEHGRDLRLKRMVWFPDGSFTTSNLTDLACRVPSYEINPGMPEICDDTIDNDCSGAADDVADCPCVDEDGDGYGVQALLSCPFREFDCDDAAADVHPHAREVCDGVDNDCDGEIEDPATCRQARRDPWILDAQDLSHQRQLPPTAQDARRPSRATLLRIGDALMGESLEIRYSIGSKSHVRLEVFDVAGRRIRTLVAGVREPGEYRAHWDRVDSAGTRVARGIYVVRLIAGNESVTRKVVSAR
jgi:hypothetical protein